jgi:hypothetical protein
VPLTAEAAVLKIQAGMRGHLWRRSVRSEAEHEQVFINMKPKVGSAGAGRRLRARVLGPRWVQRGGSLGW